MHVRFRRGVGIGQKVDRNVFAEQFFEIGFDVVRGFSRNHTVIDVCLDLFGNDVSRVASPQHSRGKRRAHESVGHRSRFCEYPLYDGGKHVAVCKHEFEHARTVRRKGFESLFRHIGPTCFHRVGFDFDYRLGEDADRRRRFGIGGVSACLVHHQFEVAVALLARAYKRDGVRYAEQFAVKHRAALVNHELHFHAFFLEVSDYVGGAGSGIAGFLVVTEAQIQVAVENLACCKMILHGFEQRNHMRLHILRPSAVDVSVIGENSRERIVFPAVLGGGDDVDVTEVAAALKSRVGALKMIYDAVTRDNGSLGFGVQKRVRLGKPVAVIEERLFVVDVFFHHRHGGNADCFLQVSHGCRLIDDGKFVGFSREFLRLVQRGANSQCKKEQHYGDGDCDSDYCSDTHIRIPFVRFELNKLYRLRAHISRGRAQAPQLKAIRSPERK